MLRKSGQAIKWYNASSSMAFPEQVLDIRKLVSLPRRRLGNMRERSLFPAESKANQILTEMRNRLNGRGPEPDADLYERASEAIEFDLEMRAIERQKIESAAAAGKYNLYPGRPKVASKIRGENMSEARGARN